MNAAPVLFLEAQNAQFQVPGETAFTRSSLQLLAGNPARLYGFSPPVWEAPSRAPINPSDSPCK